MMRLRHEDGSILPLVAFYTFLAMVLVLLVAAASSLYLERKRLFTLADGASLAGAEAFDPDTVVSHEHGPRPGLTDADVTSAVQSYLAQARSDSLESLSVDRAVTIDGHSATVELSAYWRPPVFTLFVPNGLRIDVVSTARSVFG